MSPQRCLLVGRVEIDLARVSVVSVEVGREFEVGLGEGKLCFQWRKRAGVASVLVWSNITVVQICWQQVLFVAPRLAGRLPWVVHRLASMFRLVTLVLSGRR